MRPRLIRAPALALLVAACGSAAVRKLPLVVFGAGPATPGAVADQDAGPITLPPLAPARALSLPEHRRTRLASGLELLALADRRLPLITVQLLLAAGAIDDPPDRVGLAELTARTLRQGAAGISGDEISRRIDDAGASLTAAAGYEFTSIACAGRTSALALCLRLVAALASRPSFPADGVSEVRDRLAGEVQAGLDDPETLAAQHFDNLLYGDDHPAGRPLTIDDLQRITRADLQRFHRRRYRPASAQLVVSGDVDLATVATRAQRAFAHWRGGAAAVRRVAPVADPAPGRPLLLIDKPGLTQSFFCLGHAGIAVGDPQRDAVRVMNFILGGGGLSSRLMAVARARHGKTYAIGSSFSATTADGSFAVASATRTEQTTAMLRLVRRELARIGEQPPTAAEIRAAKGRLAGGYLLRFQTVAQLGNALAEARLRGLPQEHVTERAPRIAALPPAAVIAAARRFVRPRRLVGAIVADAARLAPQLRRAGIAFAQISYLDPISQRLRRKAAAGRTEPSPAGPTRGTVPDRHGNR